MVPSGARVRAYPVAERSNVHIDMDGQSSKPR